MKKNYFLIISLMASIFWANLYPQDRAGSAQPPTQYAQTQQERPHRQAKWRTLTFTPAKSNPLKKHIEGTITHWRNEILNPLGQIHQELMTALNSSDEEEILSLLQEIEQLYKRFNHSLKRLEAHRIQHYLASHSKERAQLDDAFNATLYVAIQCSIIIRSYLNKSNTSGTHLNIAKKISPHVSKLSALLVEIGNKASTLPLQTRANTNAYLQQLNIPTAPPLPTRAPSKPSRNLVVMSQEKVIATEVNHIVYTLDSLTNALTAQARIIHDAIRGQKPFPQEEGILGLLEIVENLLVSFNDNMKTLTNKKDRFQPLLADKHIKNTLQQTFNNGLTQAMFCSRDAKKYFDNLLLNNNSQDLVIAQQMIPFIAIKFPQNLTAIKNNGATIELSLIDPDNLFKRLTESQGFKANSLQESIEVARKNMTQKESKSYFIW